MATPDINKAYQWAINTCNAPNVRYSMDDYLREGNTVNGLTYYDCSSFIFYALKAGGFPLSGGAFTTRSMIPVLLSLGFTEKPINGEWVAGDILWRTGHTEMVYSGGQGQGRTMGAHTNDLPDDDEVSIYPQTSYYYEWERLFRYGNGATGGYGSDLAIISAICANFKRMSNLNPSEWEGGVVGRWNDVNKGYGLGQWENLNTPNTDAYKPILKWTYDRYVGNSTGNINISYAHKYAISQIVQCGAGDIVVNNTPTTTPDGFRLIFELVFYKTTTTLNDTYMYTRTLTGTATYTIPADCTGVRFQIGRRSADNIILQYPDCETYTDFALRTKNRLYDMYLWFTDNNYTMDDGDAQIEFFKYEAYWITTGNGSRWANDYPTLNDYLSDTNETDINVLTEIFFNCWRGLSSTADINEFNATKEEATNMFNFLSMNYNKDAQWTSRTSGITEDEALDNAVMIFNCLSAGIGGGGNKPSTFVLFAPKYMYLKRHRQTIVKIL